MARFAALTLVALLFAAVPAAEGGLRSSAPRLLGSRTGPQIQVVHLVRNTGLRRSPARRVRFLLSRDGEPGARVPPPAGGAVRIGRRRIPRLARGATSHRTITLTIPAGLEPGDWRLLACVRRRCRIALLPVRVLPPPPPPPPPEPPPPPPPEPEPEPEQRVEPPVELPEPDPPDEVTTDPVATMDCGPEVPAPDAPAEEWTAMFADATEGWTGGDGTLSAELPSGETAWVFGDTFIEGLTSTGGRDRVYPDVNNTAVLQGECLSTRFRGTMARPFAFELGPDGSWYWPNQPVVHGDRVRIFLSRMVPDGDLYAVDGVALGTYGIGLERIAVDEEVPALEGQWWGAAFADDAEHTYVFGIQDASAFEKRVFLARTPLGNLDGAWEYRTESGWSASLDDAAPVLVDAEHVSTQLSVIPDGDGWALVSQDVASGTVNVWRGDDPWDWGPREKLTTLPSVPGGRTYNAMVHAGKEDGDQLLVSYNVIGVPPEATMADASLYRPRFVRAALP